VEFSLRSIFTLNPASTPPQALLSLVMASRNASPVYAVCFALKNVYEPTEEFGKRLLIQTSDIFTN
jgi:hypothetical protein